MKVAVYPGSFDPFTNGHLDVVDRALSIFDRVIVAVGANPDKKGGHVFTPDERVDMIREVLEDHDATDVKTFTGLTVEFARSHGAQAIVKGGAAAGADESEVGARHPHRLPDVELRSHLRVLKYPQGHREPRRRRQRVRPSGRRTAPEGEVPMKVDEILDRMEYLVHHARHVPFSSQVMVDEDEVMDMIDQLRFNLPDEIKQANWTVQEQQRLISEAHAEAARIMAKTTERAEAAVTDHEVTRRAERQAQQLVRDAQRKSDQIIRDAEAYALEQLQQLEAHLSRTLGTVKRGVEALQSSNAVSADDAEAEAEASEAAR
jgi:pantetheine-phosphate adenylyltransferase